MSELLFNVRGIFDANTRKGCLTQYGCRAYRIPPYQRGYKWRSEDNWHVERLLSDLTQAWQSHAKEYLLQAITVKKVSDGGHGGVLEVIDGQQRLTTLFILLRTLNHRLSNADDPNVAEGKLHYAIRHEALSLDDLVASVIDSVGDSTADFSTLKDEQGVAQESRQDGYYLKCAVLRCLHALRIDPSSPDFPSEQELSKFRAFVLEDVKLMVNAVEPHVSGEVIFGNLNSNRIALTETELIKGLLLTRVAREPVAARSRRYRETLELRIQLGRKWDELHRWANTAELRVLYFPTYKDGITGLLELVARQMPEPFKPTDPQVEEHPLFEYLLRKTRIEPVFRLLSHTQARLQDWYTDEETYHLLGYSLMNRIESERLPFLEKCLKCETNSEFLAGLRQQRRNFLRGPKVPFEMKSETGEVDVSQLRYEGNSKQILRILLAVSVFHEERGGRFNFHAFQEEKWSLEHIFPQSPFGKGANLSANQLNAALDILTRNEGEILPPAIAEEIARRGIPRDVDERNVIDRLLMSEPLLHQVGNLCLLSSGDNSAMGCGMFNEKRKVIRDRIARGSFVPRHTYEVFSRMIVGEEGRLDVWSKFDIQNHQAEIQKRLNFLMKEDA